VAKKSTYNAKDIEVLEGLEPVRKRPGMYIGSTNQDGLHHLVNEVLDNSIDEVLAGHATDISFQYKKDGSIKIKDNGRGIPIDFHPKYKNKRALEVVLTTLHAGGKFNSNAYKTSGGLHGVGISVVNALSSLLQVQVFKDGKVYRQDYSKGKVKTKIKIEKCSKKLKGTEISFIPDESIFEETQFVPKKLYNFINMKSVLVGGTTINFEIDKELIKDKTPNKKSFFYKKGIEDYFQLEYANNSKLFEKNFLLKSKIKFELNNSILISKLIDGKFPNYIQVIPKNNQKKLEIDLKLFLNSVDRVASVSLDKKDGVKFNLSKDTLDLSVNNTNSGDGKETLTVKFDHDLEISFNSRYLIDVASQLDGDRVEIFFNDTGSPALIKDPGDFDSIFVVMPMKG